MATELEDFKLAANVDCSLTKNCNGYNSVSQPKSRSRYVSGRAT